MQPEAYFEADTLDDLLMQVFPPLLEDMEVVSASRGRFTEMFGAILILRNPRARLSRSESKGKIFSALGELFWYLSQANDLEFMEYYLPGAYSRESDDGHSVRSGYGERLFGHNGHNQVQNVINLLKTKPSSRRAVIQLFDASDLSDSYKSIPCTCTLQFVIREDKLNLLANMRSNDAFVGLPHDVFAFTMLQEIVARSIGVEVGIYKHCAGSLHLYETDYLKARAYLGEGWQSPVAMQPMPLGDPWEAIGIARDVEARARRMNRVDLSTINLAPYWADFCRLLLVFQGWKIAQYQRLDNTPAFREIKGQMSTKIYDMFIDAKMDALEATEGIQR